jgi:uncharacterized protein (TIGR02118 family)
VLRISARREGNVIMIKLVFSLRRLPHLSRADFHRYWRETHAPLVRQHAPALRIRRHVQSHTLDTPFNDALRGNRGGPESYDGHAELWWDSLDDLQAAVASPAGQQAGLALLEDERRFIDLEHSPLGITEEFPIALEKG